MSTRTKSERIPVRMHPSDYARLLERVERDQTTVQAFCEQAINNRLVDGDGAVRAELAAMERRMQRLIVEEITAALNAMRRDGAIELANVQAAAFARLEERIEKQEQAFLLLMNRLLGVKS
jgi:hypothetical protein